MANTTITPNAGAALLTGGSPPINPRARCALTSLKLWQGISSDVKPTNDVRLAINDVFFEQDTFKYYLWDGSTWNPTTNAGGTAGLPPMRRS